MPAPVPSFTTQFVQTLNGQMSIRITDTTAWVAGGIPLASLEIFIAITSPDGLPWHPINLLFPDILPSASRVFEMPAPNDSHGDPMTGDYIIRMYAESSIGPSTYDTGPVTVNLCTDYPTLCLEDVEDCLYMQATVTDSTPYTASNFTVDSRTLTLYYPQGAGPSPIVTSSASITTPDLWTNGTYSAVLEVTITNGNFTGSFRTTKEFKANCMDGTDFCTLMCVLDKTYMMTKSTNSTVAGDAIERYRMMVDLLTHITGAAKCGMGDVLNGLLDNYFRIGQATRNCNCGCADGSGPTLLVPIHPGSSGSTVQIVVAQGTGMDVSYNAGTYTYTVSLSAVNVALLAGLYNTEVAPGTGISVARTGPAGNPPVMTDTVTNTRPAADSIKFKVNWSLATNAHTIDEVTIIGTTFSDGPITITPDVAGAFFHVNGFIASGTPQYIAKVTFVNRVLLPAWGTPLRYDLVCEASEVHSLYSGNPTSFMFGLTQTSTMIGGSPGTMMPTSFYALYIRSFQLEVTIEKLS